ncbi:MAG: AraC family transcriptional regulator [Blastocatellia bacterium]|nr:AraC family transcriptional regulator [Blastocatellia bacterium]
MEQKLPAGHFYGKTLKAREVAGFRLTEVKYSPDFKLPMHSHELAKFCFVLSGNYTETLGKRHRERRPLALAFQPPDTTHSEDHEGPGHHFLIEVETRWMEHARQCSAELETPVELQGGTPVWLATRLYNEFRVMDPVSQLAIEGLALELLAETSRNSLEKSDRRPPRWLSDVTDMLHAQFSEQLSLRYLAESVGVHTVHLARVFRQFHQCTVGEYVRQLRIEFASRQLSTSDTPLVEIASAAGFSDQSHFSRTFKRHTGLLPTEFRHIFRR